MLTFGIVGKKALPSCSDLHIPTRNLMDLSDGGVRFTSNSTKHTQIKIKVNE
jgi:hypothetical protein